MDILQDGQRVQGLCNMKVLENSGISEKQLKEFYRIMRRGDNFCELYRYPQLASTDIV